MAWTYETFTGTLLDFLEVMKREGLAEETAAVPLLARSEQGLHDLTKSKETRTQETNAARLDSSSMTAKSEASTTIAAGRGRPFYGNRDEVVQDPTDDLSAAMSGFAVVHTEGQDGAAGDLWIVSQEKGSKQPAIHIKPMSKVVLSNYDLCTDLWTLEWDLSKIPRGTKGTILSGRVWGGPDAGTTFEYTTEAGKRISLHGQLHMPQDPPAVSS